TRLAIALRVRFGDYVAAGVQIGTSSIDALHELATGSRLASSGKFIEAALELRKAVADDPGFGDAHAMLGNVYYNLSKMPEATAEFEAALRDRDRMSERRRLILMSDYYGSSGRYVESIAASEQYLARWPGDMASEVSIVATALDGQMFPLALELARRAVTDHPNIVVARSNLLLAELATGNIDQVIKDGEAMRHDLPHPSSSGILALGIAYTLRGEAETALHLFESWKSQDRESADAGRADLALYQGRVDDAYKRAHSWLDARAKGGRPLGDSNAELITLARISLRRNDRAAAREFATPAFANNSPRGKYWVASILVEAGDDTIARQLAEHWHLQPSPDTRVYARLLDGDLARARSDLHEAIAAYTEAVRTDDSWMAHARLGVAELEAKSYADAVRELELCLARRGEGAIFATPSLSLLPPIYLALAQAKAALHAPDAGEAARRVIALAPTPQNDPLTDAARALASAP
ncbi:MAG TPA: tetratricopeptide repeat protein, partial [Kofleriaceae bacterium]|nr:tetratricopeptide repeat protein [Kofleriaceae bacterium]